MNKSQQILHLQIEGMHCQNCASRIERVLQRESAIMQANVNFASEEVRIHYCPQKIDPNTIIALIEQAGFKVSEQQNNWEQEQPTFFPWNLCGLWLIAFIFFIHMCSMWLSIDFFIFPLAAQFFFSSIAQLLATPLYKSAWASIKSGLANMDVLITLGSTSTWLLSSLLYFFWHGPCYFEANVMLLAFIGLGKYLETQVKHKSLSNIQSLVELLPSEVKTYRNGKWQLLKRQAIKVGDLVQCTVGEKIPADAVVISGEAWLDQSHLTGESMLIAKKIQDQVLAGAMVIQGSLQIRIKALGKETLLGDMIEALREAQASKAPIANLADQIAQIFVPMIIVLALCTFLANYFYLHSFAEALLRCAAVLVISCPCALGLATPAAIMVALGLASRHGIWFKNAQSLEKAAHIRAIVFDKTGTLTQGQPQLIDFWIPPKSNIDNKTLLSIAASLETHSNHPLAKGLLKQVLPETLLSVTHIHNVLGEGIEGEIKDIGTVRIGKPTFTHACLPENLPDLWQSATVMSITINGQTAGALAMADTVLPSAKCAISHLKQLHIIPYVLSGDHVRVVDQIGHEVGIDPEHSFADQLPRDKVNVIKHLVSKHHQVAMVGDGVNDAPALAQADLGIAMGSGSDVANQTADVVLLNHSLTAVVDTLLIGKAAVTNIKQNLFFAFVYNITAIPLAACGFFNPAIAGLTMAISSISVIINALRLNRTSLSS